MQAYLLVLSVALLVGAFFIGRTLSQIHRLVNSRLTEALDDITALKKALTDERRHPRKGRP